MSQRGPGSYGVQVKRNGVSAGSGSGTWARRVDRSSEEYYFELNPPTSVVDAGTTWYFDHWEFPNGDATNVGLVANQRGYQLSEKYEVSGTGGVIYACFTGRNPDDDDDDVTDTKCKIVAKAVPTLGGTATGSGEYSKGQKCTINVTAKSGWRFLYWENSAGEKVMTEKHTFTVSGSDVWVAWMEERKDTHLIVRRAEGQGDVGSICYLYDKILRDEH